MEAKCMPKKQIRFILGDNHIRIWLIRPSTKQCYHPFVNAVFYFSAERPRFVSRNTHSVIICKRSNTVLIWVISYHLGPASTHDDVIKWKHFPRYWPFVRGIHRSPVNSPHKGQWPGALMFSLIRAWIYGWVNNGEACDLRRHGAHHDVAVMHRQPWCQTPETGSESLHL